MPYHCVRNRTGESILNDRCSFRSFFLGGFECSTQKLRNGRRVDVIASTHHDQYVKEDYLRVQSVGLRTVRDGVRWHLVESAPGHYNFASVLPMIRAARDTGTQIIWDLCHYGWPDDVELFSPEFIHRFRAFARAFAAVVVSETGDTPYFAPINEISFLSWAAGEVEYLNPFVRGKGDILKRHLVRAVIEAMEAIWDVAPHARFVHIDPLIHVVPQQGATPEQEERVQGYNCAVFDTWAMLAGEVHPELGGNTKYLDIIGANYYANNQWIDNGPHLGHTHSCYKPLWLLLHDLYQRFKRPLFIAETGIEDDRRPDWFAYVCDEVHTAIENGVPVEGITLYPILNHPGWDDDRHCHNGLWDYCNEVGHREVYKPLADELAKQRLRLERRSFCPSSERQRIEAFV